VSFLQSLVRYIRQETAAREVIDENVKILLDFAADIRDACTQEVRLPHSLSIRHLGCACACWFVPNRLQNAVCFLVTSSAHTGRHRPVMPTTNVVEELE
jgi:hypothetical protein